jgi:hypothetical protein
MLRLIKSELPPLMQQRMTRVMQDTLVFSKMTIPEIRAVYSELETVRDALSVLLDRADGKHV